jgi:hypothetical protein
VVSVRPVRCGATLRLETRVVRCTLPAHENGEHEADVSAHCNEPGEVGLKHEREAELTLVWSAAS